MKLKFITLLFTLAAIAAQSAFAEKADKDKPMNVEADSLKHDDQKQLTTFTGKVLMTKGTLVLKAARMEVKQDSQGNQVATLSAEPGERVFFRQKREGFDEFTEGEAEAVVYNSKADTLTLTQRAELRLMRGQVVADRIQGQQILVNNTTEVSRSMAKPACQETLLAANASKLPSHLVLKPMNLHRPLLGPF